MYFALSHISLSTFLFHTSILYITPFHHKRLAQYYLSTLHSLIVVFLYLNSYPFKEYHSIADNNDRLVMGIHIGYFASDGIYCFCTNELSFLFHHLFSIYYIYLNNLYGTIGIMQNGMLLAEASALILNVRTIMVKHLAKKFKLLETITFLTYFALRGIISPIYFLDYVLKYGLDQKQMALIAFLYWVMSVNWSYKMFLSIRFSKTK